MSPPKQNFQLLHVGIIVTTINDNIILTDTCIGNFTGVSIHQST